MNKRKGVTVRFESTDTAVSIKKKILEVAVVYKTLDPPLADRLQNKLGRAYQVYMGDNHIAIHTIKNNSKLVGGKSIGRRIAVLTDGIIVG